MSRNYQFIFKKGKSGRSYFRMKVRTMKKIRTDDYDDVLKRVAEIVAKTNHRVEIWDSKAYKHRNKDVCR